MLILSSDIFQYLLNLQSKLTDPIFKSTMHIFILFLIIGAILSEANSQISEEDGILTLTSDNFDQAIEENKFLMVEFYAPWCGHCKALYPEYVQAADILKEENSEIKLAKIDATVHGDVQSKYEVGGYPTLKYFRSGKPLNFNGQRTADYIVEWLKKKANPPAKELKSLEDARKFVDESEISIIGYFKNPTSFKAKNFVEVAEILDEHGFSYGITNDPSVLEDLRNDKIEVVSDQISLFKPFDEKRNDFKGKAYSSENIKEFIMANYLPILIEYEPKYNRRIFDQSRRNGALWLILSANSDQYSAQKGVAKKIANENVGKFLTIIMNIDSETGSNERFLELLGVSAKEAPAMRFALGWSTKYMPASATEMTENGIKQFLEDQKYGRAVEITWTKSEEISDDWDKDPVKVLVGKNFNEVIKKNKRVFVEFYAPWCGHCKALTATWDELGEKLEDRDDIMIAKIEATSNDVDNVSVRSYPTLILFKGSITNQIKYEEGDRSLKGLLKFLSKHGIKETEKVEKKKTKKKEEL